MGDLPLGLRLTGLSDRSATGRERYKKRHNDKEDKPVHLSSLGSQAQERIFVTDADLEKYCAVAVDAGATHAKQIHPASVITAPWVRLKCQFGCPGYGIGLC